VQIFNFGLQFAVALLGNPPAIDHRQYDILSEYAHPNWSGTTGLYSKIDRENFSVDFGQNPRDLESPKHVGVINLSVALGLFEHTYNDLGEEYPAFVRLCEAALDKQQPSE
jgi:hypothetical protein